MRVGIGYDIHRLETGRRLVLGGVELAHPAGLVGHSDADVVLHAVADALLGAAGLPDIGELFPDTDPAYQGADSRRLLTEVLARVHAWGLAVNNLDVIVHAEVPQLGPYKRQIAESVAKLAGVRTEDVSIKAKTNEGLGAIGRQEAIACTVVALLT